jgi:hypothetical protein
MMHIIDPSFKPVDVNYAKYNNLSGNFSLKHHFAMYDSIFSTLQQGVKRDAAAVANSSALLPQAKRMKM